MTLVSGELKLVTDKPVDSISEVWVRARETRGQGDGLVVGVNDRVPVTGGAVEFTALPGAAVLVLVQNGMPIETLPMLVGDEAQQSLRLVVQAGEVAVSADKRVIEQLSAEVAANTARSEQYRTEAASSAGKAQASESAAATSESNAKSSETNAKQSETNAGDYAAVATTAATEAVDAMETASEAAASIGDSVNAAAGHADKAEQSESGAAAYAQNASDAADRVGTAAQVGTWAQQAQDAADRIGTAEQVAGWADSAHNSASAAGQSETKAKEYRDAALSAADSTSDAIRSELTSIATDASRSAALAKTSETNAAAHEANSLSAAERAELAAEETIQQVEGDFATRSYVDQRVPVSLITETGFPEGKVTAPAGSIYTDSAATAGAIRWIKASDTGSTGWRVEYGDTGWRNVTGLLMNGWTADRVLVRRQNNTVTLSALNLSSTEATSGVLISLPGAFHTPKTFVMMDTPTGTRPAFWNLSLQLAVSDYSNFGVSTYASTQTTWQLESDKAWPTTLPGTPA